MMAIPTAPQRRNASAAPIRTVQRGSTYGWNNTLIEAATQTQDRQSVTLVDYDIHRTVSVIGRRTLMSLARTLFWRVPALQAQILEQAHLSVDPFTPRFLGKNKTWGETALELLNSWHRTFDVAGWPYDYEAFVLSQVIAPLVDGDVGIVLVEDANGDAKIQTIPSHRIGSRYQTGGTAVVRYDGNTLAVDGVVIDDSLPYSFKTPIEWEATVIDGEILDGQGRSIAHRVYEDPNVSSSYQDISARNMFLNFTPVVIGQVRGFSALASSVFDWQDVREFRRFEMLAQKAFSTRTIIEENETGDTDSASAIINQEAAFDASGNKISPDIQQLAAGTITYLKANSGSKLTAFDWDRPGTNSQQFQDMLVRDAFRGTEWDKFFSLDPGSVGGAPMRVIVDKINRVIRKRRRPVSKVMQRIDAWRVAKAIKKGELPFDPDWFKWAYQGPTDLTADRRYDAQTDAQEYDAGWVNMEDIEARRNGDWRQKIAQREVETDERYSAAQRVAQKYGRPIEEVLQQFSKQGSASLTLGGQKPSGNDSAE